MRKLSVLLGAALLAFPLFAQNTALQQAQAAFDAYRWDDAARILKPLQNSGSGDVQALLGRIAEQQHDLDSAVSHFEKAIEAQPKNAEYHFLLGAAYGQQAQKASMFKMASIAGKTKDELETAIKLNPNHLEARWGVMQYYMMAPGFVGGSEEKALNEANEIKKRDNYMGHRARAWVFTKQKKNDLSRKEYIDAVREEPNAARTHTGLGSYYAVNDKNYKAAAEEFATALRLDPAFMPAQFRIGQAAALSATNVAEGEQSLRKYLGYRPKANEPNLGSAWYYLGMLCEKQGKKADARNAYLAAQKIVGPDDKSVSDALKRVN
jgi:tetratricopeptide (TPR) repeat protein